VPNQFVFGKETLSDRVIRKVIAPGKPDVVVYQCQGISFPRKNVFDAKPQLA
jgi:hypothetical protein